MTGGAMAVTAMPDSDTLAERIGVASLKAGATVAVAESLTGGHLAAALSAVSDAGDWFRGGIVAYQPETKFRVLDVAPGPVVTAEAAAQMARALLGLMEADAVVAVTGVGGPGPEEAEPAGTVYLATAVANGAVEVERLRLAGEPAEIMQQTIVAALHALLRRVETD